ncbi:MAG: undecaprenyldiphospho-muramoylpentapeptide beta-N-acetylglucosaminyltransferase [Rickettsiales bacterium]
MTQPFTVVLATGGTGGHVFPALALAREIKRRGGEAIFFTNALPTHLSEKLAEFPSHVIPSASLSGKSPVAPVVAPVTCGLGFVKAWKLMGKLRPDVVVGFGGYASAPSIAAAIFRRIPFALHEQNAVLGKSNAAFFSSASAIGLSFSETLRMPKKKNGAPPEIVCCGNPVRQEFYDAPPYSPAAPDSPLTLLVLGGSLGASAFAAYIPAALKCLPPEICSRLRVVQQAREAQCELLRQTYAEAGITAEVAPFFSDVAALMQRADVVVSRAGASSVTEIAAMGRASILLPFPYAAHNHQQHNAEALERRDAAILLQEKGLSREKLADALRLLLEKDEPRASMAKAARAFGKPNAAHELYELAYACRKTS